jgi:hypothetical protein
LAKEFIRKAKTAAFQTAKQEQGEKVTQMKEHENKDTDIFFLVTAMHHNNLK